MKQPEEIKKGLECRKQGYAETCNRNCQDCTMFIPNYSIAERYADALAYIQQLESELHREKEQNQYTIDAANVMKDEALKLESHLAQVERERDAAVADCSRFPCSTCSDKVNGDLCNNCNVRKDTTRTNYEWRGVCPENTKEE